MGEERGWGEEEVGGGGQGREGEGEEGREREKRGREGEGDGERETEEGRRWKEKGWWEKREGGEEDGKCWDVRSSVIYGCGGSGGLPSLAPLCTFFNTLFGGQFVDTAPLLLPPGGGIIAEPGRGGGGGEGRGVGERRGGEMNR